MATGHEEVRTPDSILRDEETCPRLPLEGARFTPKSAWLQLYHSLLPTATADLANIKDTVLQRRVLGPFPLNIS